MLTYAILVAFFIGFAAFFVGVLLYFSETYWLSDFGQRLLFFSVVILLFASLGLIAWG